MSSETAGRATVSSAGDPALLGPVLRRLLLRGLAGSILVLVGGMLTSAWPYSSFESLPFLDYVRSTLVGRMSGLGIVVAGIALLSYAWLSLLPWCRDLKLGVMRSRVAVALWSIPLLAAPPLFSRDGWSYVAQGYLAREGLSPYLYPPELLPGPLSEAVDLRWVGTPAPYGPVPILWGNAVSRLTFDPWLLLMADRAFALLGIAMLVWAIPRLARYAGSDPGLASWLVLPAPLMIAHGVGGLHNDIVMVGFMAVALVFSIERSWFLAAVVVGLAAAVKAPGGIIAIGVVLLSLGVRASMRDRLVRTFQVALVAVAVLVGVGFATGLGVGWVQALFVPTSNYTPFSLTTDVGLLVGTVLNALGAHGAVTMSVTVVRTLGMIVSLGAGALLLLTRPAGVRPAGIAAAAWAMTAFMVLSPVVHPWYFFWALPLLSVLRTGPRVRNSIVVATLVLGISAPLNSSLSGLYIPILVTATLVVVAGLALLGKVRAFPAEALGDAAVMRPAHPAPGNG